MVTKANLFLEVTIKIIKTYIILKAFKNLQKRIKMGKWSIWYGHGDFCAVLVRSPICAVLARSMTAPKVDHDVPYPNTAHKFTFGTVLGGMISLIALSTQPVCTFGMVIQCKEFAVAELL